MTATLKQINVSYSRDEDRIAVKFLDTNMLEVVAWLTYSVAAVLLPHMSKVLGLLHGPAGSNAGDTPAVAKSGQRIETSSVRLQFEKEAAAVASQAPTYLGDGHKSDAGEELLVKEGRLTANDQNFQLILLAVNDRQVTVNLNRKTALAMLDNIERIVGQTVWEIPAIPNANHDSSNDLRH